MTKILPCYRNYVAQIDTLFIGFRRSPVDEDFWHKNFPNISVGETVGFALVGDKWLAKAKADYPQLDFDSEVQ